MLPIDPSNPVLPISLVPPEETADGRWTLRVGDEVLPRPARRRSPKGQPGTLLDELFLERIVKRRVSVWVDTPCHIYLGSLTGTNYTLPEHHERGTLPYTYVGEIPAHRYAYERFVGKIPDGYVPHHKCKVKVCVNPMHLRIVTQEQNTLIEFEENPFCRKGHRYKPSDYKKRVNKKTGKTHIQRVCSECARIWREKKKEEKKRDQHTVLEPAHPQQVLRARRPASGP